MTYPNFIKKLQTQAKLQAITFVFFLAHPVYSYNYEE